KTNHVTILYEVVLPRLRLDGDALSEGNHVLGSDLGTLQRSDVVLVPDLFEHLLLGAPDLRRFLDVAVDHVPHRGSLRVRAIAPGSLSSVSRRSSQAFAACFRTKVCVSR